MSHENEKKTKLTKSLLNITAAALLPAVERLSNAINRITRVLFSISAQTQIKTHPPISVESCSLPIYHSQHHFVFWIHVQE